MTDLDRPAGSAAPDALVDAWLTLWNGDLTSAGSLLDDKLVLHNARIGSATDDETGPDGLIAWIRRIRSFLPDLHFVVEAGPFIDGDVTVIRWVAEGHYSTGFPGATSPTGAPVSFTGTDILRVHDSRVVEYWDNADIHILLVQLGVLTG